MNDFIDGIEISLGFFSAVFLLLMVIGLVWMCIDQTSFVTFLNGGVTP